MADENIFGDKEFAQRYADKHQKMAENFGKEYAGKLGARGFKGGKILDAGCGFGGALLTPAKAFPDAECIGIDTSDTLLDLARGTAEARDCTIGLPLKKQMCRRFPIRTTVLTW